MSWKRLFLYGHLAWETHMPSIHDEATLRLMARIEFPDRAPYKTETQESVSALLEKLRKRWIEEQLDSARPDSFQFSWLGALTALERFKKNLTSEELRSLTGAIHVIYGVGGWNRWMVTVDGQVHFSWHHGGEEKGMKALELGFLRW